MAATTPASSKVDALRHVEALLTRARHDIEVSPEELTEAKTRRCALEKALREAFPGAVVYYNGSLAHGDALCPLTDVDLGVIVPNDESLYGPSGEGPVDLMHEAAEAIRAGLKEDYGDLAVEVEGRTRSVLVRFRDPVGDDHPDFTADVIVAVDCESGEGLYIPNVPSWDRSHPRRHTELVLDAIKATDVTFAHTVRLLKHWNKKHSKPLFSWNIKALALGCLTEPTTQFDALITWFGHAIEELEAGLTPDPAGVAPEPIALRLYKGEVLKRLRTGLDYLYAARVHAEAGCPLQAQEQLAVWMHDDDMLPKPNELDLAQEMAAGGKRATNVGIAVTTSAIPVRSWAP